MSAVAFLFTIPLYLSYVTYALDTGVTENGTPGYNGTLGMTTDTPPSSTRPTMKEAILYGLLATTLTNLAALFGLVFAPLYRWRHYSMLMSFMVATAVGSLFSTAVLVLIPEALRVTESPELSRMGSKHWYVPPSIAVCGGMMFFFTLEFLLRRLRVVLEQKSPSGESDLVNISQSASRTGDSLAVVVTAFGAQNEQQHPLDGGTQRENSTELVNDDVGRGDYLPNEDPHLTVCSNGAVGLEPLYAGGIRKAIEVTSIASSMLNVTAHGPPIGLCDPHFFRRISQLDPVVWMIIIGDGMHNFMDGLSLGAGFTMDLKTGLSLTLAIICEEVPHELGDIAILLRSGLSVSTALVFNFASACTAYLGFFLGVWLGDLADAAVYIFAVTAGFFLYIALADMLPEMRHMEDNRIRNNQGVNTLFSVHFCGLLFGFSCILAVTLLGEYMGV